MLIVPIFCCIQVHRNSETSQQTAFLAVYNTETTEILGFYQVSQVLLASRLCCLGLLNSMPCLSTSFFLNRISDASLNKQNSSEELLRSVERYWDHFRLVPQYPLYMNFISSYANNSFAREHFRKEREACLAGKFGSYMQVQSLLLILKDDSVNHFRVLGRFLSGTF